MSIRCFMLEPTDLERVSLRRYRSSSHGYSCPGKLSYHDASTLIGDQPEVRGFDKPANDDPRWPSLCACGYAFTEEDERQVFTERLYRRSDSGLLTTIREAPPGAMWRATWFEVEESEPPRWFGDFDNLSEAPLIVRTPGGDWNVDSRCSNCTLPGDRTHRCWPRTGEAPKITVSKHGNTCAAGAGSILCGNYHGFLRNGELVNA